MKQRTDVEGVSLENEPSSRRQFLKGAAAAGGAAILGASYIRNVEAAKTTTWRIQTSWPGGIGLQIFKDCCNSIVDKTGGELAFQPFGAVH
jgi:TRAP-type mannitol/chloroaromatic compound transport system substrate-binding protein